MLLLRVMTIRVMSIRFTTIRVTTIRVTTIRATTIRVRHVRPATRGGAKRIRAAGPRRAAMPRLQSWTRPVDRAR